MELTGRDETASERGVGCWVGGDVTCLPRQDLATACRGLGGEVGEQKEALGGVSAKQVFCRLDVCPGVRLETRHTPPPTPVFAGCVLEGTVQGRGGGMGSV